MLAAWGPESTIFAAWASLASSSAGSSKAPPGFPPPTPLFSATATMPAAVSPPASNGGKLSSDTLNDLFGLLDADGSGDISKSEFENALGAGGSNVVAADNVFARMDKDGDGKVSSDELTSALAGSRRGHGHHHHAGNATPGAASSSYTSIEQAIQRQTQAVATSTAASVSVSA